MRKTLLILLPLLLLLNNAVTAQAQKWSVAVNAADAASLGTVGVEASVSTGQHISINAGAKVNPWTYNKGDENQIQNREQTYSAGVRYWPWNVYSGWWLGGKVQYQEYNRALFIEQEAEEGDAFGLGISGGYSLMLTDHLNMDFGIGLWGGYKIYTSYACSNCGKITESGEKWFFLPNELILSFSWIF